MKHWDEAAFKEAGEGWELLDENGWFAMMVRPARTYPAELSPLLERIVTAFFTFP
ncbi:hypothetical protein ART_2883 [Arthrobacter sp. PAMC 25486]|uniref:hypothetical protein n=1 Tax=Arthrobacter sp. PAMC 25486 TaxID=1494608 RepID=UPI000535EFCA|nr:hypothetical protein [Arthrobacter sp. PAMC 25486]AIY02482.1 hypothetical protein ART_2883 [Arthrobacter sp. PAMC 25486]